MTTVPQGRGYVQIHPPALPYMHFMRETPNGGCLNRNLRTLPREPPATGCSLPWASLPSSSTPSTLSPHQASQLPCRIPRAGWVSFQYFCPEPWGQLQVAKAEMGLAFPVNMGSLAIERHPRYVFTEPNLGVQRP